MKKTLIALATAGLLLVPAAAQARDVKDNPANPNGGDRSQGASQSLSDRSQGASQGAIRGNRSATNRAFDRRHAMENSRRFGFGRRHLGERTARNRARSTTEARSGY